jgi:hypothetical protein
MTAESLIFGAIDAARRPIQIGGCDEIEEMREVLLDQRDGY